MVLLLLLVPCSPCAEPNKPLPYLHPAVPCHLSVLLAYSVNEILLPRPHPCPQAVATTTTLRLRATAAGQPWRCVERMRARARRSRMPPALAG